MTLSNARTHTRTQAAMLSEPVRWPDQKPAIDAALAQAELWTVAARPVIRALFAVEDAEGELRDADDRTRAECREILRKPLHQLREVLEGMRDEYIGEALPKQPTGDVSAAQWDAYDEEYEAFDDALRSVTSVETAIKLAVASLNEKAFA